MPLATQKSVDYSQGGEVCDFCKFFVEDGQDCQKVKGPIYEDMWCKLFDRAPAERESEGNGESEPDPNVKRIALILVGKPRS